MFTFSVIGNEWIFKWLLLSLISNLHSYLVEVLYLASRLSDVASSNSKDSFLEVPNKVLELVSSP